MAFPGLNEIFGKCVELEDGTVIDCGLDDEPAEPTSDQPAPAAEPPPPPPAGDTPT